jgi:uncharacterized protein (DUF2267 family)
VSDFQPPDPLTTEEAAELANVLPPTLEEAYAEGRADQLEDDRRLLAWAYGKLAHVGWTKQKDALAMDEIKLLLMGAS